MTCYKLTWIFFVVAMVTVTSSAKRPANTMTTDMLRRALALASRGSTQVHIQKNTNAGKEVNKEIRKRLSACPSHMRRKCNSDYLIDQCDNGVKLSKRSLPDDATPYDVIENVTPGRVKRASGNGKKYISISVKLTCKMCKKNCWKN